MNVTVATESSVANSSRAGGSTTRNVPSCRITVPSASETESSRNTPPGRSSIATESGGVDQPRLPHQRAICAGSVHAAHTASRGAG